MASILIADDSPIMRKNLGFLLAKAHHEVVAEAANGIEAFTSYGEYLPDVVLMDITMPVMDGITAVKDIMKAFPDAKIIMISAIDEKHKVFEAIKSGARNYIIKPIRTEKLLSAISEIT